MPILLNKAVQNTYKCTSNIQSISTLYNEIWEQQQIWLLLLCASIFATAGIECIFGNIN